MQGCLFYYRVCSLQTLHPNQKPNAWGQTFLLTQQLWEDFGAISALSTPGCRHWVVQLVLLSLPKPPDACHAFSAAGWNWWRYLQRRRVASPMWNEAPYETTPHLLTGSRSSQMRGLSFCLQRTEISMAETE